MINIREEIPSLIKNGSIGCELGVFKGDFSSILAGSGKFSKLYLVDSFNGLVQSGDKNGNHVQYIQGQDLYNTVYQKFFDNKSVSIVKDYSYNFLNNQNDNTFDFIYIDTTHTYEDTKNELEISWKKTKPGGIISGHDYNLNAFPGVVRAVDEFLVKYSIKECIYTEGDYLKSYIIYKY
jgi:hypothetical protein